MTVDAWLAAAVEDARRRGLPELEPLLETLARSTAALRAADAALRADKPSQGGPLAANTPPRETSPQGGPLAANTPPLETSPQGGPLAANRPPRETSPQGGPLAANRPPRETSPQGGPLAANRPPREGNK